MTLLSNMEHFKLNHSTPSWKTDFRNKMPLQKSTKQNNSKSPWVKYFWWQREQASLKNYTLYTLHINIILFFPVNWHNANKRIMYGSFYNKKKTEHIKICRVCLLHIIDRLFWSYRLPNGDFISASFFLSLSKCTTVYCIGFIQPSMHIGRWDII